MPRSSAVRASSTIRDVDVSGKKKQHISTGSISGVCTCRHANTLKTVEMPLSNGSHTAAFERRRLFHYHVGCFAPESYVHPEACGGQCATLKLAEKDILSAARTLCSTKRFSLVEDPLEQTRSIPLCPMDLASRFFWEKHMSPKPFQPLLKQRCAFFKQFYHMS